MKEFMYTKSIRGDAGGDGTRGERVESEVVALLRAVIALLMLPMILVYAAVAGVGWLVAGPVRTDGRRPALVHPAI